jgi:hypothetical protein
MTLQRHTGSHLAEPLPKPVLDAPRAPDAEAKKPAEAQPGQACQADRKPQD